MKPERPTRRDHFPRPSSIPNHPGLEGDVWLEDFLSVGLSFLVAKKKPEEAKPAG